MKINLQLAAFAIGLTTLWGCGKDSATTGNTNPEFGIVKVVVEHKVNNQPFVLSTSVITDSLNNSVIPNALSFYLSNLTFTGTKPFSENLSYHLIRVSSTSDSSVFIIKNIPVGTYSGIDMSFGVDSVANGRTDFVGDLDISNHMSWNWDTGYKFLLIEGSYVAQGEPNKGVVCHLGRQEAYGKINWAGLSGNSIVVSNEKTTTLKLSANYEKLFEGVNVKTNFMVMGPGAPNRSIAQNFQNKVIKFMAVGSPR